MPLGFSLGRTEAASYKALAEQTMATVVERVDTLEEVVKNLVRDVGIEFNKVYNAQLGTEMELQALKEDTQAFKDEMRTFKDEMGAFKDEMRAENREMNRR
jgi:hypothetical protein